MKTKQCKKCGKVLPLDSFPYAGTYKGKRYKRGACRSCTGIHKREWARACDAGRKYYIKHKATIKARVHKWRAENAHKPTLCGKHGAVTRTASAHCPFCSAESSRKSHQKYYQRDREALLAYQSAYYRKNKPAILLRWSKWVKTANGASSRRRASMMYYLRYRTECLTRTRNALHRRNEIARQQRALLRQIFFTEALNELKNYGKQTSKNIPKQS